MWKVAWIAIVAVAAGWSPSTARAEDRSALLDRAGDQLGRYHLRVKLMRKDLVSERLPGPGQCEADVKAWRADGLRDGDIISGEFEGHPKATGRALAFSEMAGICADYRATHAWWILRRDLGNAGANLDTLRHYKPGEMSQSIEEEWVKGGDPAVCKANVAAARAIDPAMTVKVVGSQRSLDEIDVEVCDQLALVMPEWARAAAAAQAAAAAKFKAPYLAVGIAGDKLELIAANRNLYWLIKGGAKTDDPATLKTASLLFQWATDDNDPRYTVHTIRRFQFKGNKFVKETEKKYRVRKGAPPANSVWK